MVGLDLGICFRTQVGGIGEEISTAVEYGESPDRLGLRPPWESGDEVLGRLAHELRERPVLLLGDHFEPLLERIGELDLSPCHDVFYSITKALPSNCRRQDGDLKGPFGWLAQSAHLDITAVLHPQQLALRSNQLPPSAAASSVRGQKRRVSITASAAAPWLLERVWGRGSVSNLPR